MVSHGATVRRPTLLRRSRRRSLVASSCLVLVLYLASVAQIAADRPAGGGIADVRRDTGILALLAAFVVVPLLWRRRAPLLVFGISTTAAALQWGLSTPVLGDLALLIAFYTVAATQSTRRTLAAAVVLELGVGVAAASYGPGGGHGSGYAEVVVLLTGLVVAAGVLGLNVKVRAAYVAEVEARAARAELDRDQQILLAAVAERTRIAREMHDIVAHNLSVMIALNDGASFTMRTEPEQAAEAVREASTVGRTALRELQRALGVLRDRPEAGGEATRTPAPTIAELDALLIPIRRTGLGVTLTIEGATAELSPGLQLTIYRLVQESLTNSVKHAVGADRASVVIRSDAAGIDITIVDNGHDQPAPAAGPSRAPGHGIIGMHERAAGHGGHVQTGRTPAGWMVRAHFPAEKAAVPSPATHVETADVMGFAQ
jgi:signal transduction histidine kinase